MTDDDIKESIRGEAQARGYAFRGRGRRVPAALVAQVRAAMAEGLPAHAAVFVTVAALKSSHDWV